MVIEGHFDNPYVLASSGIEAIDLLKKDPNIGIIISDYDMPNGNGSDVFAYNTTAANYPFILLTSNDLEDCQGMASLLTVNPLNEKLKKPLDHKFLVKTLNRILKHGTRLVPGEMLLLPRIALKKLKVFRTPDITYYHSEEPLEENILFAKGTFPAEGEIDQLQADGLEFAYVSPDDYEIYIEQYSLEMERRLQSIDDFGADLSLKAEIIAMMRDAVRFLCLNQNQITRITQSLSKSAHTLNKVKSIRVYLEEIISGHGYLIGHSLMCGQISYILLEKLDLLQDNNLLTFQAAYLLQDISLSNSLFAEIMELDSLSFSNLTKAQQSMVLSHPDDSAQVAASVDNLGELTQIILSHHEKPDGTGFPRGKKAQELSRFEAIFILVNRFSHFLFFNSKDPTALAHYKIYLRKNFNTEPFLKPLDALLSLID